MWLVFTLLLLASERRALGGSVWERVCVCGGLVVEEVGGTGQHAVLARRWAGVAR